jgi:hypothetical protein
MSVIYLDYIPWLLCFAIYCVFTSKEAMKLPPHVRASMYRCIPRRGAAHDLFKSMFYWALTYDKYTLGICTSYLFSWTLPLHLHASWPAWSYKRAGTLQTRAFCWSFLLWSPKGHRFEAEACRNSTSRCVIPGLHSGCWHIRIRTWRPVSVKARTCMEWKKPCHF